MCDRRAFSRRRQPLLRKPAAIRKMDLPFGLTSPTPSMSQPHHADTALASDTVTFLFTDIEGSSRLWEQEPERMKPAVAAHDTLARKMIEENHGTVVKMTGDGVHAAFDDALDALAATVGLQLALADPAATHGVPLRVRCALHAGVVERRDNDYFGNPVNRAARIVSAAHGGQVLLSQAVVDSVRKMLPAEVSLRDLGRIRLKDLSTPEHVYQVVHPQLRQEFPALRSLELIPNNLPQQVTSFIGREKELAKLRLLLAGTRLVTLTGSGGCGKTRLCLQVAADSLERFPDGAWLVELAPLSDPALVPQTVATVLGLKEEPDKPISETLTDYLKDERLLLLLDNCEHILDGCARLADSLLRQCPQVTILASSREALGIGGEQAYRVPSLSLPDPKLAHTSASVVSFEAVQLFSDRARLARLDFQVTDQNAATLASICHRLDGIPLAIELAAARVRSLSVDEISRRLDQRFQLLTGGSRTALPRQQTLGALLDWSYDLLNATEQALFCRLAIFAGGWTLDAAEQVCMGQPVDVKKILDFLTLLTDKSLVVAEERDGATRFRMLETIRQYARERLLENGDEAHWQKRHLAYFVRMAEEAEPHLTATDQKVWLDRLETEHDNLRSVLTLTSAPGGDAVAGLRLAGASWRFWYVRGFLGEGRTWLSRMLLACSSDGTAAAARAKALDGAGMLARRQGDFAAAKSLHEEALIIQRSLGDRRGIASSLSNLGIVAREQNDNATAKALYEESLALRRELGDQWGIGAALNNLGLVVLHDGDYPAAKALYGESLKVFRDLGNRQATASPLSNLGLVLYQQGDYAGARTLYQESLGIFWELRDRWGIALSLEGLAYVALALARPIQATRLWGGAERLREEIGCPLPPSERSRYDSHIAAARSAIDDDAAFESAWKGGRAMTLEEAIEYARGANEDA
jgi:predicted ATPase/class 3 adenylate cyclase